MNYLLTGKILSGLTLFILKKLILLGYLKLTINEVLLGWFLVEYIYEEYSITAVNLFFTLIDFRNSISNLVLEFQELIFKFYFIPFLKYSIVFTNLLFSIYIISVQNLSLKVKFFLNFYVYNLICYFLNLEVYWVNLILIFYFISYCNNNFCLTKITLYLIMHSILLIHLFKETVKISFLTNNFFQESFIKPLFVYSYIYYY